MEKIQILYDLIIKAVRRLKDEDRLPALHLVIKNIGGNERKWENEIALLLHAFVPEEKTEAQPEVIELKLGNRHYRAPRPSTSGEHTTFEVMLAANQSQTSGDDSRWFLEYQSELNAQIRPELRPDTLFAFMNERDAQGRIAVVYCDTQGAWQKLWHRVDHEWSTYTRPVGRTS